MRQLIKSELMVDELINKNLVNSSIFDGWSNCWSTRQLVDQISSNSWSTINSLMSWINKIGWMKENTSGMKHFVYQLCWSRKRWITLFDQLIKLVLMKLTNYFVDQPSTRVDACLFLDTQCTSFSNFASYLDGESLSLRSAYGTRFSDSPHGLRKQNQKTESTSIKKITNPLAFFWAETGN